LLDLKSLKQKNPKSAVSGLPEAGPLSRSWGAHPRRPVTPATRYLALGGKSPQHLGRSQYLLSQCWRSRRPPSLMLCWEV